MQQYRLLQGIARLLGRARTLLSGLIQTQIETDEELLARVQAVIGPLGCTATDIGPKSVAVMGDARFYGPSVFVQFPEASSMDEIAHISTKITNEVKGIARVVMEVVRI